MYLNTLKLRASSVKKHIEKLVREGLAEVRGNIICAAENLRAILTVAGND
jgi:predicted ArsR family transcriptional regulator